MATATIRERLDICIKKRAAISERRTRAEKDLAEAEAALKERGLSPKTARTAIEKAEKELEAELAEVETQLGIH